MSRLTAVIFYFPLFTQISVYPQSPSDTSFHTKIIGHKCGYQERFIPNSLSSLKQNIKNFDGVEMDVYLSRDQTLWLSHKQWIDRYDSTIQSNILKLHDRDIETINQYGKGHFEYTKLEDVFQYMALNYPDKYISLDIKPWIPISLWSLNIPHLRKTIAQKICAMQKKYGLTKVLIESESIQVIQNIKTYNKGIQCYLLALKNPSKAINKAIRKKADGISFKYFSNPTITIEDINRLHKNKCSIQVWTINSIEEYNNCKKLNIDFIQTDALIH
jgi:glycerophosphoryl diester phosphodiesterase